VVIAGSGFAGCNAVRTLRRRGFDGRITVVSPRAELFFYPSLIWVPSRRRSREDLAVPLAGFFAAQRVEHLAATVTGLDAVQRELTTDSGTTVAYDYLIVASGGRYIRKLPGIEHAHIACAGWDQVDAYTRRLESMQEGTLAFGFAGNPKEPSAMRGGPIFEFLFGVDTLLRKQGRRERFELVFFSPAPRPGKRMGEKAVDRMLGEMRRRGIRTELGNKMKGFTESSVITEGGEFRSDLTLFIPGMTGPAWALDSGLPLSEGGFIQADEHCQAPGFENVYVAGDAGSFPGPEWKPKQAHMADLQAEAAARNVIARINDLKPVHRFKTELICIIDSLNTGTLVFRNPSRDLMLGSLPPLHWAKVAFERWYLRGYRKGGGAGRGPGEAAETSVAPRA
jgi:sulfide:quinone oxidoreductase